MALFWGAVVAVADDGASYSGEPGFTLSHADVIVPEAMDIRFAGDRIHVGYHLHNTGITSVSPHVVFTVPAFGFGGVGSWYPDRSHGDLTLLRNGAKIPLEQLSRAFFENVDVTDLLAVQGIHPNAVGDVDRWTDEEKPAGRGDVSLLKTKGLLSSFGLPLWSVTNQYQASLEFQKDERVYLEYSYQIQPGVDVIENHPNYGMFDVARLEEAGLSWDKLQNVWPQTDQSERFYCVAWLNLPLGLGNWKSFPPLSVSVSVEPEVTAKITAEGTSFKGSVIGSKIGGEVFFSKDSLHMTTKIIHPEVDPLILFVRPYF